METKTKSELPPPLRSLTKNRLALLLLAVGLVILLLPSGGNSKKTTPQGITAPEFSVTNEEKRLAEELARIKNVGRVSVLLSVEGSTQRELAQSENKTLVISQNGGEEVVDLHYVNPTYKGAVIVCDGADSAEAKLAVVSAVESYTGLGSDRITVMKMN